MEQRSNNTKIIAIVKLCVEDFEKDDPFACAPLPRFKHVVDVMDHVDVRTRVEIN